MSKTLTNLSIAHAVCKEFNVRLQDIRSDCREVLIPRQVIMYLTRDLTALSLRDIGVIVHKSASAVIVAYNRIAELRLDDLALNASLEKLENKFEQDY